MFCALFVLQKWKHNEKYTDNELLNILQNREPFDAGYLMGFVCILNDLNTFTTPFHITGDHNYLRRVFHMSAKRQTRLLRLHDSMLIS